ncbi:MAG: hypothetical protein MHMPM18_001590 [Marteilia pararefringens]
MPPKRYAPDDDKKLSSGKDDGTKKFKRTHKFPDDRELSLDLNNHGLFGEDSDSDDDRKNVEAINELFGPDLSFLEDNPTSSNSDPDGSTSAALGVTTDQDLNFPGDYSGGLPNLPIFGDDSDKSTSTASQNNNQTSSNSNPDERTSAALGVTTDKDSDLGTGTNTYEALKESFDTGLILPGESSHSEPRIKENI